MKDDDRVVWGIRCVWWDTIDKIGLKTEAYGKKSENPLPCCPYCGSVLMENTAERWWASVNAQDEEDPGYRDLIEWMRGRCFPSMDEARAAYELHLKKN